MKNFFTSLRRITLVLVLILVIGLGTVMTTKAVFPDSFWRIVQVAERFGIIYGGQEQNTTTEFMSIENDGRVIMDDGTVVTTQGTNFPGQEAILNLLSADKALLVPRVESVNDILTAEDGMIVYDLGLECLKLYQSNVWSPCLGVAEQFVVAPTEPAEGNGGDAYYNTTTNQLFVHDGQTFVEITVDFELLTSYNFNCQRYDVIDQALQLRCPNDTKLTSLFFESRTFTNAVDSHIIPEINGVECCEIAMGLYWWDTGTFGECNLDTGFQTRTVTCRDENGGAVDASLCINAHRPTSVRLCDDGEICPDVERVDNGGFEEGDIGFTSEYRLNP